MAGRDRRRGQSARPGGRWWTDLALVVLATGLAGAAVALDAPAAVRLPAATALVLALPGYALVAALFPARTAATGAQSFDVPRTGLRSRPPRDWQVTAVERLALSVVCGLAVVPAVVLGVDLSGRPVAVEPVLVGLTGVTAALALVALARRAQLPPDRRFAVSLRGLLARAGVGRSGSSPLRADAGSLARLDLAVAASLLVLLVVAGYAATHPPRDDGFTELYVVTGNVTGADETVYPSTLVRGESRPVAVAVTSREREPTRYTLVATLRATGGNGTVAGVEPVGRRSLTLAPGETGRVTLDVTPTVAGSGARLLVLLYRGDPPAEPTPASAYRVLDLEMTVVEEADGSTSTADDGGRSLSAADGAGGSAPTPADRRRATRGWAGR